MDGRFGLALSAGMLAAVNPCGFAMLPAYLGWFVSGDEANEERSPLAGVLRALVVTLAVAAGFMAVFGVAGVLISWVLNDQADLYGRMPWLTIPIGLALVVGGMAMLAGWQPAFALPKVDKLGQGRGLRGMFLFGVSYAIVSISCTLPIFVAHVFKAAQGSFSSGLVAYLTYALGMTAVLMALTVTLALARRWLVDALRRSLRYVSRVAGGLLVVTGAYVAWYGWYELDNGGERADPLVDRVTGWSGDVQAWIHERGATTLLAVAAVVVALAVLAAYLLSGRRRAGRAAVKG